MALPGSVIDLIVLCGFITNFVLIEDHLSADQLRLLLLLRILPLLQMFRWERHLNAFHRPERCHVTSDRHGLAVHVDRSDAKLDVAGLDRVRLVDRSNL